MSLEVEPWLVVLADTSADERPKLVDTVVMLLLTADGVVANKIVS